jgi:Tol biopolymer transport system component
MTRFDRVILVACFGLVGAIGLTVLIGDRVGVQLEQVFPLGEAHSTDSILIRFSDEMNRESVMSRLQVEPDVVGDFSWSGRALIFQPGAPLTPGESYTVSLESGALSSGGRELLDTYVYSFEVRQPLVAYLAPADSSPQNIWLADPANPADTRQITDSVVGIFDFAVSPDGRTIAFSERRTDRPATDIKLLDIETGIVRMGVQCDDSDCNSPVWRPDGDMLAYTRVDLNAAMANVGVSPPRVWLADMTTTPAATQPLFEDTQVLGYGPQWSRDGQTISLFNNSLPGIMVYDFERDEVEAIPSEHGTSGALSPDGNRIVFPELVLDGDRARSRLVLAEVDTLQLVSLSNRSVPLDDDVAVWHPEGDQLAIGRRYWDERYTRGLQIYLMDADTGEAEPLVTDERYAHGFFEWTPNGTQLVMQRFPQLTETGEVNTGGRPEVWTYNVETDTLTQVTENGFFPRWVP